MTEDERGVVGEEVGMESTDESPNQTVGVWTDLLEKARIGREGTVIEQIANARIRARLADNYREFNK